MTSASTHSLADFNVNSSLHLARLKETGEPEVLTIDGKPEVIVQDAAAYQRLLDELDYRSAVEGIRRGLASFERGEGRPVQEFFVELAPRHSTNGSFGNFVAELPYAEGVSPSSPGFAAKRRTLG